MGRSAELWIETLRTGSVRCFHFYILPMGKRLVFGVQELGLAACDFDFFFPLPLPMYLSAFDEQIGCIYIIVLLSISSIRLHMSGSPHRRDRFV